MTDLITTESVSQESKLLPERYPNQDLFICDVGDAILKDFIGHMEHPFYSLSKKPDTKTRRYENNGDWLEVVPSVKGLATIYDKDILIYCISQLLAKQNRNVPISSNVVINVHDFLVFTNRGTSGRDYAAFREALARLDGTRIRTNVFRDGEELHSMFGLIKEAHVKRKLGYDGRMTQCMIVISDWLLKAVERQKVLTLHRHYFRLRKPLERRVYEIARKHCGRNDTWSIRLELLQKKSGSRSLQPRFRQMIRALAKSNHLPDYEITFNNDDDMVIFVNRNTIPSLTQESSDATIFVPPLKDSTIAAAKALAPGYDVYSIEHEWRSWLTERPRNADAAFLGFCRKWYEKRGAVLNQ